VHPGKATQLGPDGLRVEGNGNGWGTGQRVAGGGQGSKWGGAQGSRWLPGQWVVAVARVLLWCGGHAGHTLVPWQCLGCCCGALVQQGEAVCVQGAGSWEGGEAAPALVWPHLDVVAGACVLAHAAVEQHVDGRPVLLRQAGEVLHCLPHFDHLGAFWQLLQYLRGRHTQTGAGLLQALACVVELASN
jgi:hypothetical protein